MPASRCTKALPIRDRKTYLDYNRSGVPLVEIVTEPDMRSAEEAAVFFETLRQILVWLGVNDGNMDEGSLRCDANVSVRRAGETTLGHQDRGQERQFVPLSREGDPVRDRPPHRRDRSRRPHRAGDAAVRRGAGQDLFDAQQGRGARLSLLPGAGPAAAAWSTPSAATRSRARCRSCRRRGAAASSRSTRFREYDAALLTQTRGVAEYFEETAPPVGQRQGVEQLGDGRGPAQR